MSNDRKDEIATWIEIVEHSSRGKLKHDDPKMEQADLRTENKARDLVCEWRKKE